MLYVGHRQDGEALEAGTKKFEDLEFQQLERESSLEEERETISQQLLQERAEYHSSVAKRKVRKHLADGGSSGIQENPDDDLNSMGFFLLTLSKQCRASESSTKEIQCTLTQQAES